MTLLQDKLKTPVAIMGANGYSGIELARLLGAHPQAQLVGCFARTEKWKLADEHPEFEAYSIPTLSLERLSSELKNLSTVFLATPADGSMKLAPEILKAGVQVIDLSGAFRLDSEEFEKYYSEHHTARAELSQFSYGLVPWADSNASGALLGIANPGCYATSILMALIPLLRTGLVDPHSIVIDAKSGTTGAGRKAKEGLLFSEVDGECLPYRVGKHQHLPEIIKYAKMFTEVDISPLLVTHLLPIRRGILSSIYLRLSSKWNHMNSEQVYKVMDESYDQSYGNYPLVRYGRLGQSESQDRKFLSLKQVVGSSRTHISYSITGNQIAVFSTIDNLLKGAASQAVENWNRSNGWPVETGLLTREGRL